MIDLSKITNSDGREIHAEERISFDAFVSKLGKMCIRDRLLIEAAQEEVEHVKEILREEMQGAADLAVKLEIDMHTGNNWYEAK